MIGAGKYDVECTVARRMAGAESALLMVFGGTYGTGFSCQAPKEVLIRLPEILRDVAAQIEADVKGLVKEGKL